MSKRQTKKQKSRPKESASRRKFLSDLGIITGGTAFASCLSPLNLGLVEQLIIQQAHAEAGFNKRYLFISMPGAPSRWTFDLLLTPYGRTGFQTNPMIGTAYRASGGRYTDIEYRTINYRGVEIPHLWQFPVARAGGGNRPMTDLLDHMLVLRGISTDNPGHPGSRELQFLPSGAHQSLNALTADKSESPFASINMNAAEFRFRSLTNKTAVVAPRNGNLIQQIMVPFGNALTADFLAKKAGLGTSLDQLRVALNAEATSNDASTNAVINNQGAARQLASQSENLTTVWNNLLAKYSDLIARSMDTSVPLAGITDLPIGVTGTRDGTYDLNNNRVNTSDLRTMIDANTRLPNMAEYFAFTEFMLTRNYTSSVSMPLSDFTGIKITDANGRTNSTFDEHNSGKMVVLLLRSMYFRAFASCNLALIDSLTAAGMFNDTVINMAGEFNRNPRSNMTGSDHGWQGASLSLVSGLITQPQVLGNVRSQTSTNYPGTWGAGGNVAQLGKGLNLAHVASTIASLLGVPSPVTSESSVIRVLPSGGIQALIENGKIV
jgi:hypothetical protein